MDIILIIIAAVALIEMVLHQDELRTWEDKQIARLKKQCERSKRALGKNLCNTLNLIVEKSNIINDKVREFKLMLITKVSIHLRARELRYKLDKCERTEALAKQSLQNLRQDG